MIISSGATLKASLNQRSEKRLPKLQKVLESTSEFLLQEDEFQVFANKIKENIDEFVKGLKKPEIEYASLIDDAEGQPGLSEFRSEFENKKETIERARDKAVNDWKYLVSCIWITHCKRIMNDVEHDKSRIREYQRVVKSLTERLQNDIDDEHLKNTLRMFEDLLKSKQNVVLNRNTILAISEEYLADKVVERIDNSKNVP